jgi:hypothetical protein
MNQPTNNPKPIHDSVQESDEHLKNLGAVKRKRKGGLQ